MTRTTRQRHEWIKYWNSDDPREAFPNGRDGKPCSLLYAEYVKQRGWDRDFYNGIASRRYYKRNNRRWQRRQVRKVIEEWMED